jgi:biotin/methionine sulfoxide reductase
MHRFLNTLGGYVRSVDSYSYAAGAVILKRVIASTDVFHYTSTHWKTLLEHTDLFVSFGGMPLKNTQTSSGGVFRHRTKGFLEQAAAQGIAFVQFSPLRDDHIDAVRATWYPLVPGSDVAVMLALAHTLITEGLHNRAFLDRYCVGYETLERYILGTDDGQPKSAEWASGIAEVPADDLRALARKMADKRTYITSTWSLQRNEFGEQPPWMAVALASILGQIGLPGGGLGYGMGSSHRIGEGQTLSGRGLPTFRQGRNPIDAFIPVARFADQLLNPGQEFDYNGGRYTYKDIHLVYWAGGNPFHHAQDLFRLERAWARPEAIVVHEPWWTPTARRADIVLPATTSAERSDIGGSSRDPFVFAMPKLVDPVGSARDDFAIFGDIAERLGCRPAFDAGLDERGWLRRLWQRTMDRGAGEGIDVPDLETLFDRGFWRVPPPEAPQVLLARFREDPDAHPLRTPSGRIELHSEAIAGFGYADCPPHPAWIEPVEWLGSARPDEFHLVTNQPPGRLHSQLFPAQPPGTETVDISSADAAARGIADGEQVRVWNDRGACLARARVVERLRPGVLVMPTGAWFAPDPARPGLETNGNPNALTADRRTSALGQGCAALSTLVRIDRLPMAAE